MLKKLALATASVGLLMSTASADYYIVQENQPTETTWIQNWTGRIQNPSRG